MRSVLLLTVIVCLVGSALPVNAQEQTAAVGRTTPHNFSQDLLQQAVNREASRLADTLAPGPLQQQSQRRSWARRHPVLLVVLALVGYAIVAGIQEGRSN